VSNPLSSLAPYLKLLSKEVKILPAVGGATEELLHPDIEEVEEAIVDRNIENVTSFGETPEPDPRCLYHPTPSLTRKQKNVYHFFVDGSIRTYFLGTGIEGRRSFPIEMAQIGAAVIERNEQGRIKVFRCQSKVILLLPKQNQGISDTLWGEIKRLPSSDYLTIVDFTLPDPLSDAKKDPRDKAGAKARSEMHKLEIELIQATDSLRNQDNWLILDGSVKFTDKEIWESWAQGSSPHLIGVAKSFRKDPMFQLGRGSVKRLDLNSLLAGLAYAHRTSVFSIDDGRIAFWYVRLREQKEVDYPLMGVVKVEIPCPDKKPIPSDLADLLSCALVAERNVTPYGLDNRWHCSLYPIYQAEQVIKNRFFSKEVLMGSIRWPKPSGGDPSHGGN
jgi:hypothetical protein